METNLAGVWASAWAHLEELRTPLGYQASESAGLYSAVFGRDSLWLVLLLLDAAEAYPRGRVRERVQDASEHVLKHLCEWQADSWDGRTEKQPGKIIHVLRRGPPSDATAAALPLIDGVSYCGFDQTMLFIVAACRFLDSYPESPIHDRLIDGVGWALRWFFEIAIDPRVGLCAYRRRNVANPVHQVWKDSFDSVTHFGYDIPPVPLAWIDVQAYAYAALRKAAALERRNPGVFGNASEPMEEMAAQIRQRTEQDLWWPEEGCYGVALDGDGNLVRMITSNAGHALWAGLSSSERGAALADRLSRPDMRTPFGLRTLSSEDRFFEPAAYHRGSVWPFDNAVVAAGLLRYGRPDDALRLAAAVIRALGLLRTPVELYCVHSLGALVEPSFSPNAQPGRSPTTHLLFHRTMPPRNQIQAFSVAAQIFLLAVLARESAVSL